ncbi:unnamed protein product [Lactuca saligna]|uniref:Uncharacterized protein n=1 Tax=Lactuca saligna TaxID=75948 RepID=A0AA36ECK0_LACSI|nr:unnamed protein product [Lactuca saligna]
MQESLEGNPAAATLKNVSRGFGALTVPLTALFCYWITSNLFSILYGLKYNSCSPSALSPMVASVQATTSILALVSTTIVVLHKTIIFVPALVAVEIPHVASDTNGSLVNNRGVSAQLVSRELMVVCRGLTSLRILCLILCVFQI